MNVVGGCVLRLASVVVVAAVAGCGNQMSSSSH